jgi:AbrB family looped-hinge helix DNA binding protein
MRTAIDGFGRVLIPRPLRDQAALRAGTELEVTCEDGRIVIEPAPLAVRVKKTGLFYVAEAVKSVPVLQAARVERELDALRSGRDARSPHSADRYPTRPSKRAGRASKRGKR